MELESLSLVIKDIEDCLFHMLSILEKKLFEDTVIYIMKIINNQLDIKQGQFIQEELNIVLTKIKNRKAVSLNEIPLDVWNKEIWWLTASIPQHHI